jgi:hypothetical protein
VDIGTASEKGVRYAPILSDGRRKRNSFLKTYIPGEVTLEEGGEVAGTGVDGGGGEGGLVEQGLGVRVLQDCGHAYPPAGLPEGNSSHGRRVRLE